MRRVDHRTNARRGDVVGGEAFVVAAQHFGFVPPIQIADFDLEEEAI